MTAPAVSQYDTGPSDKYAAMRGLLWGVLIGLLLWAGVFAGLYWLVLAP